MKVNLSQYPLLAAGILLAAVGIATADEDGQYGPTRHDRVMASSAETRAALVRARTLNGKAALSGAETLALYHAEERIGARSRASAERREYELVEQIGLDCELYVKEYRARFRPVFDGWKGETDYLEPSSFWADELGKLSPDAKEVREMDFDLKFKELQRSFKHDQGALGKDCTTFYEEKLLTNLVGYAAEQIGSLASSCEAQRKEYVRRRDLLLKEFADLPAAKKLEEIDPTEIVSEQYVGLC